MKKANIIIRVLTAALLLSTALSAFAGCQTPENNGEDTTEGASTTAVVTEQGTEPETKPAFEGLILDATASITVSAEADDVTRNAADLAASTILEKAGLTLPVTTEAADGPALVLGVRKFDTPRSYAVTVEGQTLRLEASDPTTLYFAAEAVLEAWLTPDFGLVTDGALTLALDRVSELNGLATRQDHSIKVLSQNMRYTSDPDGNSIGQRNQRFHQLIKEYRPDLIGMQEVTAQWVQNLKRLTRDVNRLGGDAPEYGMVTCFREGPEASNGEAQTILYSLERFEHLDSGVIWLTDTPDTPSKLEGGTFNCVLTWAYLKDKLTGETILYGNTHLEHTHDNEHIRIAQMGYILDFLEQYRDQCPIYVSGDFNYVPDSPPYLVATEVLMDSRNTAWENLSTVDYTYHGYEQEPNKRTLDHIFHNDDTTPIRYEIISKLYDGFVSDHYGVIVEYVN